MAARVSWTISKLLQSRNPLLVRAGQLSQRAFSTSKSRSKGPLDFLLHGKWSEKPDPLGGFMYRCPPAAPAKTQVVLSEIMMTGMWWWIFWNLFTDYGHVIGEFPYPNTDNWTNKELGVPKG